MHRRTLIGRLLGVAGFGLVPKTPELHPTPDGAYCACGNFLTFPVTRNATIGPSPLDPRGISWGAAICYRCQRGVFYPAANLDRWLKHHGLMELGLSPKELDLATRLHGS